MFIKRKSKDYQVLALGKDLGFSLSESSYCVSRDLIAFYSIRFNKMNNY